MIDEELRSQILQIVREAVAAVQVQDNSAQLQTLIDELQDTSAMAAGESPYGACEGAVPGNFEPEFENGRLAGVGEGFYPVGRRFVHSTNTSVTVDSSAKIATGCIWLEVSHPDPAAGNYETSATIKGGNGFSGTLSDTVSWMPLYRIKNGAIEIDFRSAMSLTLRDL